LRAQVEVTRVEQRVALERVEIETRLAELNRLLARDAASSFESVAPLRVVPIGDSLEATLERLSGRSPELAAAAHDVERARLLVELARKESRPDFNVQTAYMNRGSLEFMWQAGVGISVPLHRRRLRSVTAEAEAALRRSERGRESVELELRARTQQRLARLASAERIAALYEQGIVPQDRMSLDAALASYQTGRVPFVAVLEALVTLYGDRGTHLTLLAGHAKLRVALEEASLEDDGSMSALAAGVLPMPPAAGSSREVMGGAGGGMAGGGMSGAPSSM
jgi:outer membrane protein TolC